MNRTIILPTDVDDPNGYGVQQALDAAGIDRDAMPALAEIVEAEWWRIYGDAAADALKAAGFEVVRPGGPIGSPEVYDAERTHAATLYDGDGLPVNMARVARIAEWQFGEWWQANGEVLEQHTPAWSLYDGDTGELIGPATNAQVDASLAELDGSILIDADGDVVYDGTWPAQQHGVRKVYVA